MPEYSISQGKILQEASGAPRYRVLTADTEQVILCEMDISKLNILSIPADEALTRLEDGDLILCEDNGFLFDTANLTEDEARRFTLYRDVFFEIDETYGPDYLRLMGRCQKPQLKAILEKYNVKPSTFWPILRRYLQSGMRECSLLDRRALGNNKGKQYNYAEKAGRHSKRVPGQGIPPSPEMYEHFDEAIKWMKGKDKKKRKRTVKSAYIWMSKTYYAYNESSGGKLARILLPPTERPTEEQFRDYVRKTIDKQKMDVIRTSAREERNDKRLLNSDVFEGVAGPADEVECDACEVPYSLVSSVDSDRTVGGATLYAFIDVLTRAILAVAIAFDQNSVIGITNLFLNLADDKQEYCAKFGINADKETIDALWPSNFLPRRIRCDRGAEFTSEAMERICREYHIELQLAPPAMGSAKGVIEHLFDEINKMLDPYLEGAGRITKRHDSTHHQDACLTVYDFTAIILNVVLAHNKKQMMNYPAGPELKDILPIPSALWKYYVEKCGAPRPIQEIEKYVFSLMTPIDAKVSKKGIKFKQLWYLADDPELDKERRDAGTHLVPLKEEVRMDMRCVGAIYYIRNDRLMRAPLKAIKNNKEFENCTMKEWEDHLDFENQVKADGKSYNDQVDAGLADAIEGIIDSAKKTTKSTTKDIVGARHEERQLVSAANKIANRLPDVMPGDPPILPEEPVREDTPREEVTAYADFREALEDFNENR